MYALRSFPIRVPNVLSLVAASLVLACGGGGGGDGSPTGPTDTTPRVLSVSVSPNAPSLQVGQQVQLTAQVSVQNGASQGVSWSTSSAAIASVSSGGLVTANAVGTATITATSSADGTKSGTATVVVAPVGSFPSVAEVEATEGNAFNPSSVDIGTGGTVTWAFKGVTHNVTFSSTGAPGNIGNSTSTSVSRTFGTAGTYNYQCTLHAGMAGRVVVH
ncbi:MAG TPA: Ig-like domain-containing protein [Gemmatimonadaceae bacterium]